MTEIDKRCGTCRHFETSVADIHGHQEGYCGWRNAGQERSAVPYWIGNEFPHPLTRAKHLDCDAWQLRRMAVTEMTATDRAKAYLAQLAPHIKGREAAEVIRELIEENDRQRDLIIHVINGAIGRHRYDVATGMASPERVGSLVKQLFFHNSTVSAEICRTYGFDPEQEIGADAE